MQHMNIDRLARRLFGYKRGRRTLSPAREEAERKRGKALARFHPERQGKIGRAVEERNGNDAHADRLCQSIPLIEDCIKKMWLAGLTPKDISVLFRQAADELAKSQDGRLLKK
jgi:hypothetical protein